MTYDAVFVCNGHNFQPNIPNFDGIELFDGRTIHSHDYRRADTFNSQFQSNFNKYLYSLQF